MARSITPAIQDYISINIGSDQRSYDVSEFFKWFNLMLYSSKM